MGSLGLLVLKRRRGQSIWLLLPDGTRVRVVLVSTDGPTARIGFEAPDDVRIYREELVTEGGSA